jgi:hypothetical protein
VCPFLVLLCFRAAVWPRSQKNEPVVLIACCTIDRMNNLHIYYSLVEHIHKGRSGNQSSST